MHSLEKIVENLYYVSSEYSNLIAKGVLKDSSFVKVANNRLMRFEQKKQVDADELKVLLARLAGELHGYYSREADRAFLEERKSKEISNLYVLALSMENLTETSKSETWFSLITDWLKSFIYKGPEYLEVFLKDIDKAHLPLYEKIEEKQLRSVKQRFYNYFSGLKNVRRMTLDDRVVIEDDGQKVVPSIDNINTILDKINYELNWVKEKVIDVGLEKDFMLDIDPDLIMFEYPERFLASYLTRFHFHYRSKADVGFFASVFRLLPILKTRFSALDGIQIGGKRYLNHQLQHNLNETSAMIAALEGLSKVTKVLKGSRRPRKRKSFRHTKRLLSLGPDTRAIEYRRSEELYAQGKDKESASAEIFYVNEIRDVYEEADSIRADNVPAKLRKEYLKSIEQAIKHVINEAERGVDEFEAFKHYILRDISSEDYYMEFFPKRALKSSNEVIKMFVNSSKALISRLRELGDENILDGNNIVKIYRLREIACSKVAAVEASWLKFPEITTDTGGIMKTPQRLYSFDIKVERDNTLSENSANVTDMIFGPRLDEFLDYINQCIEGGSVHSEELCELKSSLIMRCVKDLAFFQSNATSQQKDALCDIDLSEKIVKSYQTLGKAYNMPLSDNLRQLLSDIGSLLARTKDVFFRDGNLRNYSISFRRLSRYLQDAHGIALNADADYIKGFDRFSDELFSKLAENNMPFTDICQFLYNYDFEKAYRNTFVVDDLVAITESPQTCAMQDDWDEELVLRRQEYFIHSKINEARALYKRKARANPESYDDLDQKINDITKEICGQFKESGDTSFAQNLRYRIKLTKAFGSFYRHSRYFKHYWEGELGDQEDKRNLNHHLDFLFKSVYEMLLTCEQNFFEMGNKAEHVKKIPRNQRGLIYGINKIRKNEKGFKELIEFLEKLKLGVTGNPADGDLTLIHEFFSRRDDKVDFHLHSTRDGQYQPEEVAFHCSKKKKRNDYSLQMLSITDHNKLPEYDQRKLERRYKLGVLPGIEITCKHANPSLDPDDEEKRTHIIGYNIDLSKGPIEFINYLVEFNEAKVKQTIRLCEQTYDKEQQICLKKRNKRIPITFTYEDLEKFANDKDIILWGEVGAYLADVINKHARVNLLNMVSAYKIFLAGDTVHYDAVKDKLDKYVDFEPGKKYWRSSCEKESIHTELAIAHIHTMGGIAVLAHPGESGLREREIASLKGYKLDGIEVFCTKHDPSDINYYLFLARKYGLLVTGGSDWHGFKYTPNRLPGMYGTTKRKPMKRYMFYDFIERVNSANL
ncbi:hypothetical protein KY330_06000 [Candidatus Woesearchaeota archaeon]|nr:hypothetical protein [Candidatus Woesearchaeota archaeon]